MPTTLQPPRSGLPHQTHGPRRRFAGQPWPHRLPCLLSPVRCAWACFS